MDEPATPSLRRARNLGGNSSGHLRQKFLPEAVRVGHESVGVGVLLAEIGREIGVVGVGHPMVGVVPRHPVNRNLEWDFLRRRRWWCNDGAGFAERTGEEAKRLRNERRFGR